MTATTGDRKNEKRGERKIDLIAKAASRAKRKTLARARIAAADLLREEIDAAGDVAVSKTDFPQKEEKKNKEKEHDKFSKLERGGRKGGKPADPLKNR